MQSLKALLDPSGRNGSKPHGRYTPMSLDESQSTPKLATKEAVLSALQDADPDHVAAAIQELSCKRPDLCSSVLDDAFQCKPLALQERSAIAEEGTLHDFNGTAPPATKPKKAGAFSRSIGADDITLGERAPLPQEARASSVPSFKRQGISWYEAESSLPVVQFGASDYYVHEDESHASIQVVRIGDISVATQVRYKTMDHSAVAGRNYEAVSGVVTFECGEKVAVIEVPLIDNDHWDTNLEFEVQLLHEDLSGGVLGGYLWRTQVKVLDNDAFPSNKFQETIAEGKLCDVNKWFLLKEYMSFVWRDATVRRRTLLRCFVGQLHNLWFFTELIVQVYMVDDVLDVTVSHSSLLIIHDRFLSLLMLVVILKIGPFTVLHVLDAYAVAYWGVGGRPRATLQIALLRKFLNYSEVSKNAIENGEVVMAMTSDCQCLAGGYTNAVELSKMFGQLLVTLIFNIMAPVLFDKPIPAEAIMLCAVFPMFLYVFLELRRDVGVKYLQKRHHAMTAFHNMVDQTVNKSRLISDYQKRAKYETQFQLLVLQFNVANREVNQLLLTNRYFVKWLGMLCVAVYTLVDGYAVISGKVSLGMFLANVRILLHVGTVWGDVYDKSLEMQLSFPALERITNLMNMASDLNQRKMQFQHRRKSIISVKEDDHSTRRRKSLISNPPFDQLPIRIDGLSSTFKLDRGGFQTTVLNLAGVLEVQQGSFVVLVGPHGEGKSTLLKILGAVSIPEEGQISKVHMPGHLRVLHVSPKPLFFRQSLLQNLTLGVPDGHMDAHPQRVKKICQLVGIGKGLLSLVDDEDTVLDWESALSQTECQLLSIARALVANYEVICLHTPTNGLSPEATKNIMCMLKEFVDQRGVEQGHVPFRFRRPRTCIITSSKEAGLKVCDKVFSVSKENGIREESAQTAHAAITRINREL